MEFIKDKLIRGVWGEHAMLHSDFNGGPNCATQGPNSFKYLVMVCTLPLYIYTIKNGISILRKRA